MGKGAQQIGPFDRNFHVWRPDNSGFGDAGGDPGSRGNLIPFAGLGCRCGVALGTGKFALNGIEGGRSYDISAKTKISNIFEPNTGNRELYDRLFRAYLRIYKGNKKKNNYYTFYNK